MKKCKFTSTFSTSCRSWCTGTGSTECTTEPLINQNISFSRVANNNRHLSGNQMPFPVVGNEICCDPMKISRGICPSGDVKGSEGPERTAKHMGSNKLKTQVNEGPGLRIWHIRWAIEVAECVSMIGVDATLDLGRALKYPFLRNLVSERINISTCHCF